MAGASKYVIGVDFGTLSGRTVVVDVATGTELAEAVYPYSNGVIDEKLPDSNVPLEPDWALQDPDDYVRTYEKTIPAVVKDSGVSADDIIGIGIDFTACTMLPVKADGTPLCRLSEFRNRPNAWVKLWKHHAAQPEANKINQVGTELGEEFLKRYGGKYSSEWFFSKLWQTLDEDPQVYDAADLFVEATDWAIWQLTGTYVRNECTLGYKTMWIRDAGGFPSTSFFKALDPRLENVVADKLGGDIMSLGARAGGLTSEMADKLGLRAGTAVAVGHVDAHAAVPACTVTEPGKMVMIMGTSLCHMVLGDQRAIVPGMCGVVENGIVPGYWGFEAGQSAVGDIYAWYVEHAPYEVVQRAKSAGRSVHDVLAEDAMQLSPGQSGLLALDWWNGNRSVLVDVDLTGVLLGATLATRPHEIYRALIESTAFGTNMIVDTFEQHGVHIEELYACGGLAERSPLVMQIFADVTGRPIKLAATSQPGSLGSAMHAAVAAGVDAGGYATIKDAAAKMARVKDDVVRPSASANATYKQLFEEYRTLHDYFGRGANDVMKRLKKMRREFGGAE